MATVLVTGATGIVGRTLMFQLISAGKTVIGLRRSGSNLADVAQTFSDYDPNNGQALFESIIWKEADLHKPESLQPLLTGVSEVYHTAARVSFDPKDDKELVKTNVEGTRNLLYAMQDSSVKKFCFISSIATLDGQNAQGEVDEEQYFNPKLLHSEYQRTKFLAEMEVWRASAEGLNCVIVNPGMIIGSGNWHSSSGVLFQTALESPFAFSGGTGYVDVRDVAAAAIELMEENIFGERFLLVSENWRYKDFYNEVRRLSNVKPLKILPSAILTTVRFVAPVFAPFFKVMRMATPANLQSVSTFTPISNEKIKSRIGFEFIPVKESIKYHFDNYISHK